jgi:hypothetical protein
MEFGSKRRFPEKVSRFDPHFQLPVDNRHAERYLALMKNYKTLLLVGMVSMATAASASANRSFGAANTDVNPNQCRSYDMVVDAECPGYAVQSRCEAAEAVLEQVGKVAPSLDLDTECDVLHTGNFLARMLDETIMQSTSSDGYTLVVSVDSPENKVSDAPATLAEVVAQDADSCADAAALLTKLTQEGLQVTAACTGAKLNVSFQF